MQKKQAIILCGGSGSRLKPQTLFYNKALVPINEKFIIDFPIETLKQIGITDLIVILGGEFFAQVVSHLKDGSNFGMNITYVYQREPDGIASAINLAKNLILNDTFFVILGDNIFDNIDFTYNYKNDAHIFLKEVPDLKRFGVVSIDKLSNKIAKIEEKPLKLEDQYNQYAATGLYRFDRSFFSRFEGLQKSARGEYEITSIINSYLEDGRLDYSILESFWIDCGTHQAIKSARSFLENK